MRELSFRNQLSAGSAHTARQEITVAGQLLTHLETYGVPAGQLSQADLDSWLAEGPSTRYTARTFVVWAIKTRRLPAVTFLHRKGGDSPILTQDERLALLRRFLTRAGAHHHTARSGSAPALRTTADPDRPATPAGQHHRGRHHGPAPRRQGRVVPEPVLPLLTQHLHERRNINTAANVESHWLFPATGPDSHCTAPT